MLGEPPRSEYDLHFTLFGLPVRIHPWFWLIALLLGINSQIDDMRIWMLMLIAWVAALFVSILVHELGHALPLAYVYGARTWIVLHGMGGLALHQPYYSKKTPGTWGTIGYTIAGPFAGFALAAVVVLGLLLCRIDVTLSFISFGNLIHIPCLNLDPLSFALFFQTLPFKMPGPIILLFYSFFNNILFISVFWGLMNLLPIYPLDGGHVAREIFLMLDRRNGIANSLWLSVFTGGVIAVLALMQWINVHEMQGFPFISLLFGYFAFQSYQMLTQRY